VVLVSMVVLAACGGDDDARDTDTVPPVSTTPGAGETSPTSQPAVTEPAPTSPPSLVATPLNPAPGPTTARPGAPIDPDLPLVQGAVADLAARLDLEAAAVTVVDALAVTWGDSSLGCPEPGMSYLQRLVDGTLVVLKAGGKVYEYHGGDPLFLCETPPPTSGG
jgi:hypothetical protein